MVVSRLASIAGGKAARKLAKKLATKLNRSAWRKKHYKSLKPYAIKAKSLKGYKKTKFQKPKIGGGAERHPQQLSYGVGAKEHPITSPVLKLATRRGSFKGSRHLGESWRSEMTRYFGGLETGSRSIKRLHKSYTKDIRKLRKKLKTKLSVGGLVIGKNVDLSLL